MPSAADAGAVETIARSRGRQAHAGASRRRCASRAPMPRRASRPRARATSTRFRCGRSPMARSTRSMRPWPRDRDFAPAGRGTGDGGRRRYRALDRGRHVQRQRCDLRVNVLVKPIRSGLKTNLVITTSRRTYLLGWLRRKGVDGVGVLGYPRDRMLALQRQAQAASAAAPVDPACRWRRPASATRSAVAIRRGSRCAPSTTARRSISSSPPASRKASCRRCS